MRNIFFEGLSLTDSLFSVFDIPINADVKAFSITSYTKIEYWLLPSLFSRSRYPKPLEKITLIFSNDCY